jgi:hypothetical protein
MHTLQEKPEDIRVQMEQMTERQSVLTHPAQDTAAWLGDPRDRHQPAHGEEQ